MLDFYYRVYGEIGNRLFGPGGDGQMNFFLYQHTALLMPTRPVTVF